METPNPYQSPRPVIEKISPDGRHLKALQHYFKFHMAAAVGGASITAFRVFDVISRLAPKQLTKDDVVFITAGTLIAVAAILAACFNKYKQAKIRSSMK